MTIDDVVATTRRVIAEDGWDEYLPTLILPKSQRVRVLTLIPRGVDIKKSSLKWAKDKAGGEEFFVAFKIDPFHFRVIHHIKDHTEDGVYLGLLPE